MTLKPPSKAPPKSRNRVVINDSSCVIDLWKVGLLRPMLRLPYRFAIALPVQRDEMLDLSAREWDELLTDGLDVIDLVGTQISEAMQLAELHASLSPADCLSLALARAVPDSILLTGDAQLKVVSEAIYGVQVHGVLWVADELHRYAAVSPTEIGGCLERWRADPAVFLPDALLNARIRKLKP